jgi:hypothetical protein
MSSVNGERLGEVRIGVRAREQIAQGVVSIGEVLDDIAGAGEDRVEPLGCGLQGLVGDDAIAPGLLRQMQFRIARIRLPVDLAGRVVDDLLPAGANLWCPTVRIHTRHLSTRTPSPIRDLPLCDSQILLGNSCPR